jgi:amino acid transporter
MAFVAAEMRDRRRNIPLALMLGTAAVTVIYLAVNAAYLFGLGFDRASKSHAIAADVLEPALGKGASNAMCLLVMISALGAVNGLIFTSSRIYVSLGTDHGIFAWLSRWHPRLNSPVSALTVQAVITLAMIVVVGSELGRDVLNTVFVNLGLGEASWQGIGGFFTLLRCTAPVFWLFFLMTGISLFVLRVKDRQLERPFRVPLFPIVPLIFCATCAYMLYGGIRYADKFGLVGGALLLLGVPLYLLSRKRVPAGEPPV